MAAVDEPVRREIDCGVRRIERRIDHGVGSDLSGGDVVLPDEAAALDAQITVGQFLAGLQDQVGLRGLAFPDVDTDVAPFLALVLTFLKFLDLLFCLRC